MSQVRSRLRPGWLALGGLALFVLSLVASPVSTTAGPALVALALAVWLLALALFLSAPRPRLRELRAFGSVLSILVAAIFALASVGFMAETQAVVAPSPEPQAAAVAGATATAAPTSPDIAAETPGDTPDEVEVSASSDSPSAASPDPSPTPAPTDTPQLPSLTATPAAIVLPTPPPVAPTPAPIVVTPAPPPVTPRPTPPPPVTPQPTPPPTPQPTAPQPTAQPSSGTVTVGFLTVTSPVSRGGDATASVQTYPGAACTVTVVYASGPSSAPGLAPQTASSSGAASWTWLVGTDVTAGTWPVTVKCTLGPSSTWATANLQVQ